MTPQATSSASGEQQHWGIVGGGMLGLTLAHLLRRRGATVTIIERAHHLGGLASAWSLADVTWDRFYHVILPTDKRLRSLLRELDLEQEIRWVETRTGCYADGRVHSVSNAIEFLRFSALSMLDKLRIGATLFYGSRIRDGRRLEQILVSDWLVRWSGRRAFQRFWLPLLRSKLGDSYREASAAFIWAVIRRLHGARHSGLKREMFGYVPGGYARILERFSDRLLASGVRIDVGKQVRKVACCRDGIEVLLDDRSTRIFDRAIVTSPTPITAELCPGLSPDEHARLRSVQYLGVICASVLTTGFGTGFYVTNLLDDELPFTGVIETSAIVKREHLGGHSLLYLPRYTTEGDPYLELTDAEIRERFLTALEGMHPDFRREDILAFRVARARRVLALSTLGYSDNLPPIRTSVPGLYLVNSAQIVNGTLNVNETVSLAERALPVLLH